MWYILQCLKFLFLLLCVQWPLEIIGIPLVIIGVLMMDREDEHMPGFFKWWDYVSPLPTPSNGNTYDEKYDETLIARGSDFYGFRARFGWYMRNQMDYFNTVILGIPHDKKTLFVQVKAKHHGELVEPEDIGDREGHVSGYRYVEIIREGKKYFEIYWIKPYRVIKWDMCIRFRLGYKLWGSSGPYGLDHKWFQLVISFNPFFPFRGVK